MISARILAVAAALIVAGAAFSHGREEPAPEGSLANPVEVTVTATDYAFDAPRTVPAGYVKLRMVNRGREAHHVQLVKLAPGKTIADAQRALQAGGPPPSWATEVGGPGAADPGAEANATTYMPAGEYVLLCFVPAPDGKPHFAHGMVRPLTVTARKRVTGAAPRPDATIRLVDYGFDMKLPVRAGRRTFEVWTDAPQPHEVILVKLNQGATAAQFLRWVEKPAGPPPGRFAGGVSGLAPRERAYFTANLRRGTYTLVCFVPDHKDGRPHILHGMVRDITVE
jgi:uncharacterized cupredoxin-like copper-binding protein